MSPPFPKDQSFIRRSFLLFGMGLLVLALVWFVATTATALLLIFAAVLVAVGLDGVARLMYSGLGISRHLSVIIAATAIVVLLAAGVTWGGVNVMSKAPKLERQVAQSLDKLSAKLHNSKLTQKLVKKSGATEQSSSSELSPGKRLTNEVTSVLSVTMSTIVDTVLIAIIGLYLALEPQVYQNSVLRLFPSSQRHQAMDVSISVAQALRRWLLGRGIAMLTVGVFSVLGLYLIGIPFALLLGLLAGVLTFVPYLGAIISAVPALLIAALQGLYPLIYTGLLYLSLHVIEGYILAPMVQKRAVSMAPAFLLIAQTLGGAIAGVLGITLAAPVALVLAVILQLGYVRNVLGKKPHLPGQS